jgi:hypothetical protein
MDAAFNRPSTDCDTYSHHEMGNGLEAAAWQGAWWRSRPYGGAMLAPKSAKRLELSGGDEATSRCSAAAYHPIY